MDDKGYIFRGRKWSNSEIEMIKEVIKTNKSRTEISKRVCELINWRTISGQLKDAACREVLRRMEMKGLIVLPSLVGKQPTRGLCPKDKWESIFGGAVKPKEIKIQDLRTLEIRLVNTAILRNFWEYLIDKYHYLGYKRPIGKSIKYLIYLQDKLVGAIGFADAVLKLNLRDMNLNLY